MRLSAPPERVWSRIGPAFWGRDFLAPSETGAEIADRKYEIPWGLLGRLLHPVASRSARKFARSARNLGALLAEAL